MGCLSALVYAIKSLKVGNVKLRSISAAVRCKLGHLDDRFKTTVRQYYPFCRTFFSFPVMAGTTTPVLIAGAGPVGLVAAYTLAHHGIPCMLVERNASTTRWPKMDITNVRSMEILRKLGLADQLREQGEFRPSTTQIVRDH